MRKGSEIEIVCDKSIFCCIDLRGRMYLGLVCIADWLVWIVVNWIILFILYGMGQIFIVGIPLHQMKF